MNDFGDDNSTDLESAAAAGVALDTSTGGQGGNNILPAILTPLACIIFVLILVASFKMCNYTRRRKARRSYSCTQTSEIINEIPEEPSTLKCVNCETQKDFEDREEEDKEDHRNSYQPIDSSSSVFSLEEAKSEDFMIINPHGNHHNNFHVEVEIHPFAAEGSSPRPFRLVSDADSDDSEADTPLCVAHSV